MTRRYELAAYLRQLGTLFTVLGVLASIGWLLVFLSAVKGEAPNSSLAIQVLVYFVVMWAGIAWTGTMAKGLAEVLHPTEPSVPHGANATVSLD